MHECNVFYQTQPPSPPITPESPIITFPSQLHELIFKPTESAHSVAPEYAWTQDHLLEYGQPLRTTLLRKTDSPSLSSHQLPVVPQIEDFMILSPVHAGILSSLLYAVLMVYAVPTAVIPCAQWPCHAGQILLCCRYSLPLSITAFLPFLPQWTLSSGVVRLWWGCSI